MAVFPPGEAVRLCGDHGVLIADARSSVEFAHGHITDAVHLPCIASGAVAGAALARLAGRHTLVVYGDSTDDARPVARELGRRVGRPDLRIVVIDGGFAAWSRAGLACSSGRCPDCQASERRSVGPP